ncbi:DUF2752 domain-containing protein [Flagellimonas allohymeniacidonis]|uniref:DUF2752 domain-containing protein n=1 Tax=Flagellimonas allohymeniacidonis TaxID=2517819 RepID=A0A4Q8QJ70_9FLAO|nr:DUF2752 domain-containing protein [Allomuricauda hymeniacidonis]TAI49348.1 DUF2752 domain-containing protein [Allomuricauda hymeniacidonis]
MLPCLNKQLFGLDCPGCGLQRSLYFLLHGEFMAAFKMYPAIYPMILLLFFLGSSIFVKFRFAGIIKWSLISLTVGTILVSYFIKMNNLFN